MGKNHGFGLGLRHPHYQYILQNKPKIDWFEIISENYIAAHKGYHEYLLDIRADYPIFMHGVSLSIGGSDPFDMQYLQLLKNLHDKLQPPIISDHLCFTSLGGHNSHDLLPVPYNHGSLEHIISRVQFVQEYLGRNITLENASTYVQFKSSDMHEAEFLNELHRATDCGILLDINNVFVSCYNHGLDAREYIDMINHDAVVQFHLAGHKNMGEYLLDTHNSLVCKQVWDLFKYCYQKYGAKSTMIEWDSDIPEFLVLEEELNKAKAIACA